MRGLLLRAHKPAPGQRLNGTRMKLVCGVVSLDGRPVDPTRINTMLNAMLEPGQSPRRAIFTSETASLATLDFSATPGPESLPQSADGSVLAADARLYDTADLAKELSLPTDAESGAVLLTALGRFGPDAFNRMEGDFAAALWNPSKRELTLGRDAMGIRPLVYFHDPGKTVVFASFPRGVHASGALQRLLDPLAVIRESLTRGAGTETIFQDVSAVAPGSYRIFSATGSTVTTYWRPAPDRIRFRTFEEASAALRDAMVHAVEIRLGTTGTVAAHLSGGLDSSALAIIAVRKLRTQGRKLLGYSFLEPPEAKLQEEDETPFVEAVLAQEPDIQWSAVPPGKPDDTAGMKRDRMLSSSANDPENVICADAQRHGAELILSGWGGDEASTFNGRGGLADAFASGRWLYLARQVQAMKRLRGFRRRHTLRGEVLGMLAPGLFARLQRLLRRGRVEMREAQQSLFRQDVLDRAMAAASPALVIDADVRRNQLRLIRGVHIAVRTTNWAEIGAPYGIAFAFPMLDRRVLDIALSLHPTWHLRGGLRRSPFREAMRGILPETVRMRFGKITPFPSSVFALADHTERLRNECEALIQIPVLAEIFDIGACRRAIDGLPTREQLQRDPLQVMSLLSVMPLLGYGRLLADNPVASPKR
jgi:asparagine synthase (glutamine-hydrolysing)